MITNMHIQLEPILKSRVVAHDTARPVGTVQAVRMDPKSKAVTHIVIADDDPFAPKLLIPWNKVLSLGDHEIHIKTRKGLKEELMLEPHEFEGGWDHWKSWSVVDKDGKRQGNVDSLYLDSDGIVKKVGRKISDGKGECIRASSVIQITKESFVIRPTTAADPEENRNSKQVSDIQKYLASAEKSLITLVNGALSGLQRLHDEVEQTDKVDRRMLDTAVRTRDSIVRRTNKEVEKISREVADTVNGYTENPKVHAAIEILNEQIGQAQQLMERQLKQVETALADKRREAPKRGDGLHGIHITG